MSTTGIRTRRTLAAWLKTFIALGALPLAACGDDFAAHPEDTAEAVLELRAAPVDAGCVRLTVNANGRSVYKSINFVPGGSTSILVQDLPSGPATFSAEVYPGTCETYSATPSWVADPVMTTITAGDPVSVTLTFRRPERASVSLDFPGWAPSIPIDVVAGHGGTTCAAFTDGTMRCRGFDDNGQLGAGDVSGFSYINPFVYRISTTKIASGRTHGCALLADRTMSCWGRNSSGQLGLGTVDQTLQAGPTRIANAGSPLDMAVGLNNTCVVLADRRVACWGSNTGGVLGTTLPNSASYSASQFIIAGVTDAANVSIGRDHACAVTKAGSVYCWGSNASGQLGDGTTTSRNNAVVVPGLTNVAEVAAGSSFTCARTAKGEVYCWGYGSNGVIGDGSTSNRSTPFLVWSIYDVTNIDAGGSFACAAIADGTVRCWGMNNYGQLGDGTTTNRSTPVIPPIGGVLRVSAGDTHACALTSDNQTYCWGDNASGQLGDSSTTNRSTPVWSWW